MTPSLIDLLTDADLDRLEALLAARRTPARTSAPTGFLDTRRAADYLGITHRALLQDRQGIPFSQSCPGGKRSYRVADLDASRQAP